ncbi:MAG TPA: rhodanese-like domain-containing protein [Caulobacter sp.]|nr:rhodanese-like domain-containing protein [Caulobacter sp.]
MTGSLTNMTPSQLDEALRAGDILLVDVREPAEFAVSRIHGAVNFPLSTFDPKALLATVDPATVVLQCGSGKRSAMAAARCQEAGFAVTRHLAGGINAWQSAGLHMIDINAATGRLRDPA